MESKFQCQRCGNCCRGPGWVYVTDRDIRLVAKHLGTSPEKIESSYTCRDEKGMKSWTLPYGICTWLSGRSCLIYPVRPEQCRTFPFWPDEEWEEICKICPGARALEEK